ncbi:UDP-N-acetylglucosamine--undecaprenyl-phosphate N-acetylglucosaminephosphotransferase [Serratia quinivorans]|uniref:UDP-N-acetylglucosamine--undecaprenyl-phosphate N-acetylglucosaminephosphotransferase n=1 Tax=Serratia quinivorans TaxID=137545 RepID=UPI001C453FA2|nr:UDP-N-acetylglucosamine--undecaprenyl-phosphate N-acetylglucosaminephosphotransferase [Serratia quinivorans]MBV6693118.1 UDP-N-acetylglucosamine--undecaprenyl-phosphate N-acetylglucosaminephosphotransferase [Serratia quinivorans]
MAYQLGAVFLIAIVFFILFRHLALTIGLVDKPDARKQHKGNIPLVGGVVIYISLMLILWWMPEFMPGTNIYILCVTMLVFLGGIDDRFNLPVNLRIVVQGGLAFIMIISGMEIGSLGKIWGSDILTLGYGTWLLTPIAVWGAISAYNMIDGIDGQLGVQSCVTFASLAIIFTMSDLPLNALWCLSLISSLLAFLLFNLNLLGANKKVFMGDSGSMAIGFTILWLLINSTQGEFSVMRPITALWLAAIPIMDMATVILRRILHRRSPFRAGRDHLHHILMQRGLTAYQALAVSSLWTIIFASVGVLGEMINVAEQLMSLAFLLCFISYFIFFREPHSPEKYHTES